MTPIEGVEDIPAALGITPDGKTVYVLSNHTSSTGKTRGFVVPIRTATNTALKPVKIAPAPSLIAITPDGETAYVTGTVLSNGLTHDFVVPIRTITNTALKPVSMGHAAPAGIGITPDGKTAYVAGFFSGTVTPISTATNRKGTAIKVGENPVAIAITP